MATALLSPTYFGPVQWYQKLYRYESCLMERCGSFAKQTYRNRCVIATASGPQALTVPVERGGGDMGGVRISDHASWRRVHWNAISSAYGESPFFEFYEDDLKPFFQERWERLYDFDMATTEKVCELLGFSPRITHTTHFVKEAPGDFRETIRPKHPGYDPGFSPKEYYQVFKARTGFLPNLSILDLLFNEGPEAVLYL